MMLQFLLLISIFNIVCAFLPHYTQTNVYFRSKLFLSEENEDENVISEKKMIVKLKAEATTPFRLFRQFIYGAVGAAGGLGTFTAIPQLIIAIQSNGDLENAVKNLAIDVVGIVSAVIFWKIESDNELKKISSFEVKQKKMDEKLTSEELKERELELAMLPIEIQVSEKDENITRTVSLRDLQLKGLQNVVIVAGSNTFVKDAMISARLEGAESFFSKNIIIVPFTMNSEELSGKEKLSGQGFKKQSEVIDTPYIAKPKQFTVWQSILEKEFFVAEKQTAKDVLSEGMVLVIKKSGIVSTRGLGLPPWKKIISELFRLEV